MPARSTCSITSSSAARSRATGFSQKAGSPASAANRRRGAWAGVGAASTSASTPASTSASGVPSAATPSSAAVLRARSASASASVSRATLSSARRVEAWREPIRPTPTTPTCSSPVMEQPPFGSAYSKRLRDRLSSQRLSGGRRGRGAAHDELGLEQVVHPVDGAALRELEQQLGGAARDLRRRLVHGRERRGREAREAKIVEADDRHVARDGETRLVERAQDADRR